MVSVDVKPKVSFYHLCCFPAGRFPQRFYKPRPLFPPRRESDARAAPNLPIKAQLTTGRARGERDATGSAMLVDFTGRGFGLQRQGEENCLLFDVAELPRYRDRFELGDLRTTAFLICRISLSLNLAVCLRQMTMTKLSLSLSLSLNLSPDNNM